MGYYVRKVLSVCIGLSLLCGFSYAQSDFLSAAKARSNVAEFEKICDRSDAVSNRVLFEYGSLFVASDSVGVPKKCVFENEAQVSEFHKSLDLSTVKIGGTSITLQKAAMTALLDAINEAKEKKLNITPRGGSIAGLRDYGDTLRLWNSRFYPALAHWIARGKISKADATEARNLAAHEQVPKVLAWEAQGFWFSTSFDRTILSSVAAPGTSQHLSGLAADISEYSDRRVREILSKNGWFQTVISDTPHFTYLGHTEDELPGLGLISKHKNGYKFWVPEIPLDKPGKPK